MQLVRQEKEVCKRNRCSIDLNVEYKRKKKKYSDNKERKIQNQKVAASTLQSISGGASDATALASGAVGVASGVASGAASGVASGAASGVA